MVAVLTDASCWLKWKGERDYVICQGNNLLLTPAHDWMHNCTWDWTRKWYPSLMKITVWPNHHQGIINILSGGTVVWFRDPAPRQTTKLETRLLLPKSAAPVFYTFPVFWGWWSDCLPFFDGLTVIHLSGPKIKAISGISPPAA